MGIEHSFGQTMRKQITNILPENTAMKWEARMRDKAIERNKWVGVNDLLAYSIENDEIDLHIHEILTKNPTQIRRLLISGFCTIATQLKTDPQLVDAGLISGWSSLAYLNESLVKLLKFRVVEKDDNTR